MSLFLKKWHRPTMTSPPDHWPLRSPGSPVPSHPVPTLDRGLSARQVSQDFSIQVHLPGNKFCYEPTSRASESRYLEGARAGMG